MKRTALLINVLFCTATLLAQPKLSPSNIDEVIAAMTLEEKADLLVGGEWIATDKSAESLVMGDEAASRVPGAAGHTTAIPRLGIPSVLVADGPAGLRIYPKRKDTSKTFYTTAFPVGCLLASTWDTELVGRVGQAMGNEVLEYGLDAILGPSINLMRHPLCGRNFEYYSEDPLLTGKIAAAMIRGIQSQGVGTSLKHYAVNNQETNRPNMVAHVDDRTMRELYLRGFEIAVKEGQPWTVMTANNNVNDVHASESPYLLTDILRSEWGYQGVVMTDWLCGYNPVAQIHAGNELLMPGLAYQRNTLLEAMKDGSLSMDDVDRSLRRILGLVVRSPYFHHYKYNNNPDLKAHAQVTRNSAAEGMVLLSNNGALPLKQKRIALFGNSSYNFLSGGTGSGDANNPFTVSLLDGLKNNGFILCDSLASIYEAWLKAKTPKQKGIVLPKKELAPELVPDENLVRKQIAGSDAVVYTLGRVSGEGRDRDEQNDFLLTAEEQQVISLLSVEAHRSGKPFIVVLNIGGVVETASWKDKADAILLAWQGGQEGGNSVSDILCGRVNPSGKLPMTFPVSLSDLESNKNFPLNCGNFPISFSPLWKHTAYAKAIKVEQDQGRRNIDHTYYEEGLWVGYRDIDHFAKQVSFPFGFGLSYTLFSYAEPHIQHNKMGYTVTLNVTNTGAVAGKEIVQLYVSAPQGKLVKPVKELKAFAKTRLLKPGESQKVTLTFTDYDLASFDATAREWIADKGKYIIAIGASSKDLRQKATIRLRKALNWPVTKTSPEIVESLIRQ